MEKDSAGGREMDGKREFARGFKKTIAGTSG
jgi:hypothetical protein